MLQSAAMDFLNRLVRISRLVLILVVGLLLIGGSNVQPGDRTELVRAFTRDIEFDYVGWTIDALREKLFESALGTSNYLSEDDRHQIVFDYLELVSRIHQVEWELGQVYADPDVSDPHMASEPHRLELELLYDRRDQIAPVAESILQSQISTVVDELGLAPGGQPFPPVLYHATPLPLALIVSPRDVIRQDENISLAPDISVQEQVILESQVDQALDVSSLVVNIGGVGLYPTMVSQTSSLDWLSEVVAHEWVHNYLSLRPLGVNYLTSPELRVINETTAGIAGKEIGRAVLERFYPELVPPPPPEEDGEPAPSEPPAFDFRQEMHKTRVTVDELLDEGRVEEAEEYMEERRKVFWENGYRHLRKLNQAYFAFHGAYADEPGGAAGATEDPVGEAVRALRRQSPSLADFLKRISWMSSFDELQQAVEGGG